MASSEARDGLPLLFVAFIWLKLRRRPQAAADGLIADAAGRCEAARARRGAAGGSKFIYTRTSSRVGGGDGPYRPSCQ